MSQKITITIDGEDGIVRPDSSLLILENVFLTLKSIDAETWKVGTRRLEWRLSEASLRNPFEITYSGDVIRAIDPPPPDIAVILINGCKTIETHGTFPPQFTTDDVKRMSEIGKAAKKFRRLEFQNSSVGIVVDPIKLRENADELLANPTIIHSFGAVSGVIGSLQNYPDKTGASATIVTRLKQYHVRCALTAEQAKELAPCVNKTTRVALRGKVTYENGSPKSIVVRTFDVFPPDDDLPTLEQLREMRSAIPTGTTIEDFVSEMRGDE